MTSWKLWVGCLMALSFCALPALAQPVANSAKAYVEFGIANGKKGDYNAAIAAFDAAVEIDPKFAPAYYNRGLARVMQNDMDGALGDYSKAIEVDPNYAEAYYQRGSLKGKQGDFDAAISDFQQAIKSDPKHIQAHYNLGHVYYFRGDQDNALTQLNEAIKLEPDASLPYFIRGLIERAQGHRDEAIKDFQKSSSLNFAYGAFWTWIFEMENNQHGLAEEDLSNALQRPAEFKPDDWPSQIAKFLLDKITFDQLIAAANQGVPDGIKGQQCEAYFYGGMVKHLNGDDKGASELFQKAIATNSTSSEEYIEAKRWLSK